MTVDLHLEPVTVCEIRMPEIHMLALPDQILILAVTHMVAVTHILVIEALCLKVALMIIAHAG